MSDDQLLQKTQQVGGGKQIEWSVVLNGRINHILDTQDAWITGLANCPNCDYQWVAVMPMSTQLNNMECPACEHSMCSLARVYTAHKCETKIEALIK